MNNENQTPTRSVDFYDNGAKFFEYTNPDGEITYGKVTPLANGNARFDWEESAPEDWEDAEPFILAELDKTAPNDPISGGLFFYAKQKQPSAPPPELKDLTAYLETHYEISTYLALTEDSPGTMAQVTRQNKGIGGLYELAKELTDQFTEQHAGKLWGSSDETDYFDVLAEFMREKENQQREK